MFRKKRIYVGLAGLAVIGFGVFAVSRTFFPRENHVITLRKDGFYPREITIQSGEDVTFISKTGEEFWPASNLHPSHEIFPEFDPKRALRADESWSFRFTKEGRWGYHDHLHANLTGKIIVTTEIGLLSWNAGQAALVCLDEDVGKKQQCWDEQLTTTLENHGLDAAFDLFVELYKTEPSVAKGCHGWGHILGSGAYQLFADKKDFVLRDEAAYCGYGFYHGFLEELLLATGDPRDAIDFCNYAIKHTDSRQAQSVFINCIHGIGHGSTADAAEDPKNQGDVNAVLAVGKKYCTVITNHPEELQACWEGMFNELQQNINFSQNGFSYELINDDFFWICRREEKKYKKACYFEFIGLIAQFTGRDFSKAAQMVLNDITDPSIGAYLMIKMAADFMQDDIVHSDYDKNVLDCRNLPTGLQSACFNGILLGFVAHGEPGQEYVKGLGFCNSEILTSEERAQCYSKLFGDFRSLYTSSKISDICGTIQKEYQRYCRI